MAARKIKISSSNMIDESPLKRQRQNNDIMINDLPNNILLHILTFLSTKDAAKTSILAINWRYLWTYLSLFDFHMLSTRQTQTLKHQSRVLSQSSSLYLVSLTELSLQLPKTTLCNLPTDIPFPNLKTLTLSYATFTSYMSLEQFLSRCPLLQDLTLNYCYWFNVKKITIAISTLRKLTIHIDQYCLNCHDYFNCSVVIDAVNLLSLTCTSVPVIQFRIVNPATSTLDAYIGFGMQIPQQYGQDVPPCSLLLLSRFASVKSLTISKDFHIFYSHVDHRRLPEFHNLTHLCLDMKIGYVSKRKLMEFLVRCPKLEVLDLALGMTNFSNDGHYELIQAPPCFKSSLKTLHISNFDGLVISFAEFLLKNARLLEDIKITWSSLILPENSKRLAPHLRSRVLPLDDLKNQLVGMGSCAIKFV